jgi:hypothetical protein
MALRSFVVCCKIFCKIWTGVSTETHNARVVLESKTGHDGPPAMSPLFSSLRRDSLGVSFLPANYSGDFAMRAIMQDDLLSG